MQIEKAEAFSVKNHTDRIEEKNPFKEKERNGSVPKF